MEITFENEKTIIDLGEALTIANIEEMYEKLQQVTANEKKVIIRADALNKIDTASLQLLLSLNLTLKEKNLSCQWEGVSPHLADKIDLLNFNVALNIPSQ